MFDGGETKYLFKRDDHGWFKVSDNKKIEGNICFALNVDPDCKPYNLQLLLRQMDKNLLESYHIPPPPQLEGTVHQKHIQVDKYKRVEALNRMVFREKKASSHWLYDRLGKPMTENSDPLKYGRPVYFVTIGDMNSSRIQLKKDACYTVPESQEQERRPDSKPLSAQWSAARSKSLLSLHLHESKEGTSEPKSTGTSSIMIDTLAKAVLSKSAPVTVDGKEVWVKKRVLDRFKKAPGGKTARLRAEDILSKQFVSKEKANIFASKHIKKFKPDSEDEDFEVVENACPTMVSNVLDCLVVLAKAAEKNGAAFIIPDFMTSSSNSALIEKALEYAEFTGPVITVCRQEQAAIDEATARQTYASGDNGFFPTGILHSRATHSILVPHAGHHSICAKLARVISEPDLSLFSKKKSAYPSDYSCNKRIMIVAGSGTSVMEHIAAAVKENIPIIVLQGSRGLSDYLPKVWLRRLSPRFNTYNETKKFCKDCGFHGAGPKSLETMTLWMHEILDEGHLNTHPLSTSIHAFRRILQSLEIKDDALLQGMVRYCEYRSAMRNMERPDKFMLLLKLLFGVLTTLSSTVAGAMLLPGLVDKVISREVRIRDLSFFEVLVCIGMIVFPSILSVIVSLQQDYNYTPKILALKYAAALIEGEMFRYRARSGRYSDEYIMNHKFDEPTTNEDDFAKSDPDISMQSENIFGQDDQNAAQGFVAVDSDMYDTLSIRARWFTEKLIKIGEKVPIFDCPDPDQLGHSADEVELLHHEKLLSEKNKGKKKKNKKHDLSHLPKVLEKLKKLKGVEEIAGDSLEEWESELRYGTLSGSDFADLRLKVFLKRFEDEADQLDRALFIYKVAIYGIGVAGGILSLTGFEVCSMHTISQSFILMRVGLWMGMGKFYSFT